MSFTIEPNVQIQLLVQEDMYLFTYLFSVYNILFPFLFLDYFSFPSIQVSH